MILSEIKENLILLSFSVLFLLPALTIQAQGVEDADFCFTLDEGENVTWKPFLGKSALRVEILDGSDIITAALKDGQVFIVAKKTGTAHLKAQGNDGQETAAIWVSDPGLRKKKAFEGTYNFKRIKDNYRFTEMIFNDESQPFSSFTWARIGKVYICLSSELTGEGEAANKFDNASRMGYESFEGGPWEYPYGDNDATEGREAWSGFNEDNQERGGEDSMESMEGFNEDFYLTLGADGLSQYYVGEETVLGISCWVFDAREDDTIGAMFWVHPDCGLCLKRLEADGGMTAITRFSASYKTWDKGLKP